MINAYYLTKGKEELSKLEDKIKKLGQVVAFSCPPVPNPNNMNPDYVIVRKGKAGDYESCDICPFPGCELSLIDLQKENIQKPIVNVASPERIQLTYDSNIYTIFFRNNI
ncbi:Uncharacterised protein [uncultured archaeon]|nr:Uncharacterised protein [uncultured archaeon]